MRREIAWSKCDGEPVIVQVEINEQTEEVRILSAYGEFSGRGEFDVIDAIENDPRQLDALCAEALQLVYTSKEWLDDILHTDSEEG